MAKVELKEGSKVVTMATVPHDENEETVKAEDDADDSDESDDNDE